MPLVTLPSDSVSRNALVLMAVVAGGATLYWLRDILTPLAMAIFLLIMIDGLRAYLEKKWNVPRRFAGGAALTLVVLGFALSIWIIVDGAAGFFSEASGVSTRIGPRLDQIIQDGAGLFGMDPQAAPSARELVDQVNLRDYVTQAAMQAQGVATGAAFVLIYLAFLIVSQSGFRRKMVGMFPDNDSRDEAVEVMHRVRSGVEGYLWIQTVTGVMICAAAYLLMMAVGLDNALFWTFVIFVVGFIPVLGGAIAGLAPPLFALVQFDSYWPALVLLAGLQVILFISGNIIQPRMQGENQNIDPVVVLLALAFWGHLWGVVGMFLSTPLAVAAMAILAEFRGSRWIAVLLSGDGQPYEKERAEKAEKSSFWDRLRGKATQADGGA